MKKELLKIFWTRYKVALILLSVFLIGFGIINGNSRVNSWKASYKYYTSEQFEKEYLSYKYKPTETLEEYQLNQFRVYFDEKERKGEINVPSFVTENRTVPFLSPNSTYLLLFLFSGFLLFFIDLKTGFNQFLFSIGFQKRNIFLTKYLLIAPTLVLSLFIGNLLQNILFFHGIPNEYMNGGTFAQSVPIILLNTLLALTLFTVGTFLGVLMGQLILGVITLLGFTLYLHYCIKTVDAIRNLSYFIQHHKDRYNYKGLPLRFSDFEFHQCAIGTPLGHDVLIILIFTVGLFLFTLYWYPRTSLENTGKYLLQPSLKKVTFEIVIISSFVIPYFINLGGPYTDSQENYFSVPQLLARPLSFALTFAVIGTIIAYLVIYQLDGVKHLMFWKKREISLNEN
ncbi:MAG: hypothetical protein LBM95_00755 [Lactobacillales bacterium]|jgi:hypothetical protein|nr:hypothetical protein [Lactobacillales bacterium]